MSGLIRIESDASGVHGYESIMWYARIAEVGRAALKMGAKGIGERELTTLKENLKYAESVLSGIMQKVHNGTLVIAVEIHGTSKEELNGQPGEHRVSGHCRVSMCPLGALFDCRLTETNQRSYLFQVWCKSTYSIVAGSTSSCRTDNGWRSSQRT